VTRQAIREAIQCVLREHVEQPFLLLREVGLQARLWCLLRQGVIPDVVNPEVKAKSLLHQHTKDFKTSRVQLEVKVGGTKKSDIVVLRADRKPRLTCWPGGPTDVVAAIAPDDVEAVIEIKAAPSRSLKNQAAFLTDIKKLDDLRAKHPHLQCYFVLIDKSLPVPGAVCDPCQSADESWPLELQGGLQDSLSEGVGSFVEVWDLVCNPDPTPRKRYWVRSLATVPVAEPRAAAPRPRD
jgi:hypothetical protein